MTSYKHPAMVALHCYRPLEHSKATADNKVSLESHQQNNQEAGPMHILFCDLRMTLLGALAGMARMGLAGEVVV